MIHDFTVLMPIYNRADLFKLFDRAVNSVYANSIQPNCLLIVVDGPLDVEFRDKVLLFEKLHSNIKTIWIPENVGLTKALNIGIENIDTKWTIRADGDDYNHRTRFERQLKYLSNGFDLVGGWIKEVDENGDFISIKSAPSSQDDIEKYSKYRNPFNHMTVGYRTDFVRSLGGYPNIFLKEDYSLWALFIKNKARMINIDEVLVDATTGKEMYKRRGGMKYVYSEFLLQRHLVNCNIKGVAMAVLIGVARSLVFLTPSFFRGKFYERFLRIRSNS